MSVSVRSTLLVGVDIIDFLVTEKTEVPTFDRYTGQPNGVETKYMDYFVMGNLKVPFDSWMDLEFEDEVGVLLKKHDLEFIKLDYEDDKCILGKELFCGNNWEMESKDFTFNEFGETFINTSTNIRHMFSECGLETVPEVKITVHAGAYA